MTRRPAASTPPVTGDACGRPSARVVISTMWCRGRANSSSPSRSTVGVRRDAACHGGHATRAGRDLGGRAARSPPERAGEHQAPAASPAPPSVTTRNSVASRRAGQRAAAPMTAPTRAPATTSDQATRRSLRVLRSPSSSGAVAGEAAQAPDGEHDEPEQPRWRTGPTCSPGRPRCSVCSHGTQLDAPAAGVGEGVPDDVGERTERPRARATHGRSAPPTPGDRGSRSPTARGTQVAHAAPAPRSRQSDERQQPDDQVDRHDAERAVAQPGGAATGEEPRVVRRHRADDQRRCRQPLRAAHHRQHGRDVAHGERHAATLAGRR